MFFQKQPPTNIIKKKQDTIRYHNIEFLPANATPNALNKLTHPNYTGILSVQLKISSSFPVRISER